jgi:hypothetical protein
MLSEIAEAIEPQDAQQQFFEEKSARHTPRPNASADVLKSGCPPSRALTPGDDGRVRRPWPTTQARYRRDGLMSWHELAIPQVWGVGESPATFVDDCGSRVATHTTKCLKALWWLWRFTCGSNGGHGSWTTIQNTVVARSGPTSRDATTLSRWRPFRSVGTLRFSLSDCLPGMSGKIHRAP